MDEAVYPCTELNEANRELLQRVEAGMGILADVNRADILLYAPVKRNEAIVVAHAQPHSVAPVYTRLRLGSRVVAAQEPLVLSTLQGRFILRHQRAAVANGAPIVQRVLPVRTRQGQVIAALCVETNLIEHERHRRRSKVFQWAVHRLQHMVAQGELGDASALTPFGEHDGILLVDRRYRIRYASGIATNLYRRLGLMEGLVGKKLHELGTCDAEIVAPVFDGSRCVQEETNEGNRTWIKRGVPILAIFEGWKRWSVLEPFLAGYLEKRVVASLILIRDTTESRLKEQEIKVKTALIREVHHRVKNNLQTIAALLRMQARRSESEDVRQALSEGINRILSVAVVHEFLAHQGEQAISLREVANTIVRQIRQGMMDPEKRIHIELLGPDVLLPAQQATSCALVINELLVNSIEHGFAGRVAGTITVELGQSDSMITISVSDDGTGLPAGFDVEHPHSLGLQIVRTLVQDDLKGTFYLENTDQGVHATVSFRQSVSGGE